MKLNLKTICAIQRELDKGENILAVFVDDDNDVFVNPDEEIMDYAWDMELDVQARPALGVIAAMGLHRLRKLSGTFTVADMAKALSMTSNSGNIALSWGWHPNTIITVEKREANGCWFVYIHSVESSVAHIPAECLATGYIRIGEEWPAPGLEVHPELLAAYGIEA